MAIERGIDGSEPIRPQRIERLAGAEEKRRSRRSSRMGGGTLACPSCDAPVALRSASSSPADPLGCPFCGREGTVRDFLSLTTPARPARVGLYVVAR